MSPLKYTCSACGSNEHTAAAHKDPNLNSQSAQAAIWIAEHGGTCQDAGTKFGVSKQAVNQAWRRLFPERPTPRDEELDLRRERIVELATARGENITAAEIAETVGCQLSYVLLLRRELKLSIVTPRDLLQKDEAFDRAIEMIRQGSSAPEAAAECGVSIGHLARKLGTLGIENTSRASGRHDGRGARGAVLVAQGMTVSEASRQVRCAPGSITSYMKRQAAKAKAEARANNRAAKPR